MTQSRYAPNSAFASCPAATGEAQDGRDCPTYPDTAHRCRHDREPHHGTHDCLCGHQWACVDLAAYPEPRHSA